MPQKLFLSSFFPVILTINIFSSPAQVIFKDYNSVAVQAMLKGRTYAVLTNDSTFNQWFRQALGNVWTVSEITYIKPVELDSFVKSDKNVFMFAEVRDDRGAAVHLLTADDMGKKKDFIMMLSQGGFKQTKYLFTPSTSGPKIIGFFRYSPERSDVTTGLIEGEMLLAFMNQSLQIIIDNKIRGGVRDSIWEHIYVEAPQIKDKTMLFNTAFSDGTIELDKKVLVSDKLIGDYPFPYQQTTPDTIREIFSDNPGNYCYLFLFYPSAYVNKADDNGDILVYDPSQKKFLYYDDNFNGPWFEKGEMKDLIYSIKER